MKGRTVLITRRREQAADLASAIRLRGGTVVFAPLIGIADPLSWEGCDRALEQLAVYDAIIFASVNAVEKFFRRSEERHVEASLFHHRSLYAVGPATAAALRSRGVSPEELPADASADGLLAQFGRYSVEGRRILLPRSEQGRRELPEGLRALGAVVDPVDVYRTIPPAPETLSGMLRDLESSRIDVITFASPSAVHNFVSLMPPALLHRVRAEVPAIAIGPTTGDALGASGWKNVAVARTAGADGMAEAAAEYFQQRENA